MRKSLVSLVAILRIVIGSLTYATDNELIIRDTANWTITVYSQDKSYWITIQDKNLWAENVGDYWKFFQWWNNNWNPWDSAISTDLLVRNSGYNNKGYDGTNNWFIKLWNWSGYTNTNYDIWGDDELHDNVWWGWSDNEEQENVVKWYNTGTHEVTNYTWRQWPCEEWYHVPSAWEWQELMMLWCNANPDICSWREIVIQNGGYEWGNNLSSDGIWTAFSSDLLLPFAGNRVYYDGIVYDQGDYAFYWSSSPRGASNSKDTWLLILSPDYVDPSYNRNRAFGQSIRCFKNFYAEFPKILNLSFISEDVEVWTWEVVENMTGVIPEVAKNLTKTGYVLEYRYLSGVNPIVKFDFTGTAITADMADENDNIYFIAKWTKIQTKPSWGSSGGGRSSRKSDTDTQKEDKVPTDSSAEVSDSDKNTENVIQSETKWSEESSNTPIDSSAKASEWQNYSEEFQQAYKFAHENWITTMPTIEKAKMNWKLTRIAMAKMLSQYAMNVLWQKPSNVTVPKFDDVTEKMDSDYDDWVTLAYQLWIMWQNMPNNKFRPNDEVTRAEFATALSRIIYWTSDGEYKWTWKYYIHHMEKLVKEWIITKDDPNMKELRGYVMIMLMRSAK